MSLAIKEAGKSIYPFGAVLVKDGKIVTKSGSGENNEFEPANHAEINVIRKAFQKNKNRDLKGSILYTTCEPCPMCFSASWYADIDKIIYLLSIEESSKLFYPEIKISINELNKKGDNKIKIEKCGDPNLKKEIIKIYKKELWKK